MLKLHIEDDEGHEKQVPIIRDEITIGRQEGNTIRLTERNVSRRHARILREDNKVFIETVEARYGIYRNGEKLAERAEFVAGDVYLIGDYRLTLQPEKSQAMEETPLADGVTGELSGEPTAIKSMMTPSRRASEGTEILPALPAKLVIISSNFAGQEFPLEHREVVIGRSEDCDIIIDHRSVSQRHAKIVRDKGANYQIIDLNSKNGVRISGDKYTSTHLKRGDIVELGHVKFRFVEPGENYIFTPQSIIPDGEDYAPGERVAGKRANPLLFGGLLVAGLLAIIVVAFVVMSGDEQTPAPLTDPVAATTTDTASQGNTTQDPPEDFSNEKISEGIASARASLESGDVDKAVGILEGLKYANPDASDKEKIGKLISRARAERAFQKDYIIVKDSLQKKNHLDALRALKNIPSHSLFVELLEKKGHRVQVIDGVLDEADDAISSNNRDTAESLIEEVLSYESENTDALALKEKLNTRSIKVAAKVEKVEPSKPDDDPPKKVIKKAPKKPKPSSEEAAALRTSANKKLFSGDTNGAITDCREALRGGASDCHRIMAIAYKNQGNKSKACASFQKALRTAPSKAPIQTQMSQLGCE